MCNRATYRCACGHVAEWHYRVHAETGMPITRDPCKRPDQPFLPGVVRCPSPICDCKQVTDPQPIRT